MWSGATGRGYRDGSHGLLDPCARRRHVDRAPADNWRERDFHPVARQVAIDYPPFSDLGAPTPYWTRHTFISCCLQAGISLATIAAWCGTSIQMISDTYGRMIRRYEGLPPVDLEEQFQTAKVEAMSLLSATRKKPLPPGVGLPVGLRRQSGVVRDPRESYW